MAGKAADTIKLTSEEQAELDRLFGSGKTEHRLHKRIDIVLRNVRGESDSQIGKALDLGAHSVGKWRRRFAKGRLAGLGDAPRSGKPAKYSPKTDERILAKLDEPVPDGYASWNGDLLAKALGDVSNDYVWKFLRRRSISLSRRRSWCVSTDPEFVAKSTDVIGLYLNPPENALVLCIDEKPSIQALERHQGWLKLPNGRSLTGFSHEYKRRGTSTLLAALDVATGMVKAGHFKTKTRRDFLAFLDSVLEGVQPRQDVHVIVDNYATHLNLPQAWHERNPNVYLHFTPTHASWLNQIETWFSILWRGALKGASFKSVQELCQRIDLFIAAYNQTAHPFEWKRATAKPKSLAHSVTNL